MNWEEMRPFISVTQPGSFPGIARVEFPEKNLPEKEIESQECEFRLSSRLPMRGSDFFTNHVCHNS